MADQAFLPLMTALAFPAIDPVALRLGPLAIHWYGIGYVVGILFAWHWAKRLVAKDHLWAGRKPGITALDLDDFVFWSAIGIIVGGRLGYVLFYDLPNTLADPLSVFAVWKGGMSFHGGFLGCTIAMVLFARRRGLPIWSLFDVVAAGAPVGLGLVRVANFINGELYGRTTDVAWGVIFPGTDGTPRHASQIYEAALEGILLFMALHVAIHAAKALARPGLVSGLFVAGYGLSRILVEFFREPDAQIGYLAGGWLTMGMVLSLPMVLIGIAVALRSGRARS